MTKTEETGFWKPVLESYTDAKESLYLESSKLQSW
jgi:hypothetical protein